MTFFEQFISYPHTVA